MMQATDSMAQRSESGFTLMELLVVVAIMAILLGVLLPAVSKSRDRVHAAECLSNLRQLGGGFHMYAGDHRGFLPSEELEGIWFVLLVDYIPDEKLYQCPTDPDVIELGIGPSYSWRDSLAAVTDAASLAGKSIDANTGRGLVMVFDGLPDWHGAIVIQASAVDTSAKCYRVDEFEANLARSVN